MNSLLPLLKPVGLSTFDLIRIFKKTTKPDFKVGHAGTLDVFADGLAILLLGDATKKFADFQNLEKTYIATARLGVSSTTLDTEGDFTKQKNPPKPTYEEMEKLFADFPKSYEQDVPAYSAAKHEGKPLYQHALEGNVSISKSKTVQIYDLKLIAYKYPLVTFKATVSSGTYIRQLGVDLFTKLKLKSFLTCLTRLQIGEYQLDSAANLGDLYNQTWERKLIKQD